MNFLQAARARFSRSRRDAMLRLRARRALRIACGLGVCALVPPAVFQLTTYRRNLAAAREKFPSVPALTSRDRILILSPHCDDETLGAGGTIARARRQGIPVRVAFLTNGDGSRSTQIAYDARHLQRNSFQQLAVMRQRETIAALKELGVARRDIVFLGYPDGGTQAMWQTNWRRETLFRSTFTNANRSPYGNSRTPQAPYCGQSALADVVGLMRDFRPTLVLTTHPADTHPDHWAAYAYARAALEVLRFGMSTHAQTEDAQTKDAWAKDARLLTFLVHHAAWPAPHGYHPSQGMAPPADLVHNGTRWMQSALDDGLRKQKKRALMRYTSQLATTPQFLRGFLRRNELFGDVPVHLASQTSRASTKDNAAKARDASSPEDVVRDPTDDSLLQDVWPAADLQSVSWRPARDPNTLTLRILWKSPKGRWPRPRSPSSRWSASRGLLYRLSLHAVTAQNATTQNVTTQNATTRSVFGVAARATGDPGANPIQAAATRTVTTSSAAVPTATSVCEIEVRSSPTAKAVLRSRSDAPQLSPVARSLVVRRIGNGLEIDVPRAALISKANGGAGSESREAKSMSLLLSASVFLGGAQLDQTETGTLRLQLSSSAPIENAKFQRAATATQRTPLSIGG